MPCARTGALAGRATSQTTGAAGAEAMNGVGLRGPERDGAQPGCRPRGRRPKAWVGALGVFSRARVHAREQRGAARAECGLRCSARRRCSERPFVGTGGPHGARRCRRPHDRWAGQSRAGSQGRAAGCRGPLSMRVSGFSWGCGGGPSHRRTGMAADTAACQVRAQPGWGRGTQCGGRQLAERAFE